MEAAFESQVRGRPRAVVFGSANVLSRGLGTLKTRSTYETTSSEFTASQRIFCTSKTSSQRRGSMAGARIYNSGFRNKAEELKTIIPNPKATAVCGGCGSVYEKKRWFENAARASELKHIAATDIVKCPACVRSNANYPEGILTISGEFLKEHHDDILHTITHTAKMERERDTLCRLMGIKSSEEMILVKTTNERLVRRIGHVLHSAYGGELSFVFSHGVRLTRVRWHRDEPGRAVRENAAKKKAPMKKNLLKKK